MSTNQNIADGLQAGEFNVVFERDEDGIYVASVPALPGCHTQAPTLDLLLERIKEAIVLHLATAPDALDHAMEFIGVRRVSVEA
ncbi:MAG: type II toxin-antitoxin system HicB family antitoxin [Hyphomicrobiaceae bacterium]